MTKLVSEAAAAMAKAGHAKRTPEERSQKAAKAAQARWEGNGLTSDQKRVLRKLDDASEAKAHVGGGPSGRRFESAAHQLHDLGIIVTMRFPPAAITYRRGPKWRPGMAKRRDAKEST